MSIETIAKKQRNYFYQGETLSVDFRKKQLMKLKKTLIAHQDDIVEAVHKDFGKSSFETYVTEIQVVYDEINYMLKNLKKLAKPQKVRTPLLHFYSKSKIMHDPLGTVLIISPWNYPLALALTPLAGAIAAGNCAVIKPSEVSSHTSALISKIITENFDEQYLTVYEGEADTTQTLLKQGFDHCFFTGSTEVGKKIMQTASKTLTPVTLELGGKSPCVVTEDADIVKAACRIVWGKFVNAGQTCIAPDFVLVHESVKHRLILLIQEVLRRFYGEQPLENDDYARIITEKHFDRLVGLMDNESILHGGEYSRDTLSIAPTLVDDPDWDSQIMTEEIFGPLLPIIGYDSIVDTVHTLQDRPKPLAFYLFTESEVYKEFVMGSLSFGGGCINDTLIHFANLNMPFGGVGHSGMGNYHGKYSFDTFTHSKSVTEKTTLFDIPLRYPPYSSKVLDWLKKMM
ncbi:aldehyde dehydrogenase [Alkalibacterium thalassium]|uniref:Aldehyde dehydrogenase n=1 Tax=Alkalibacterium thalassium TaxID=426701 RepID=A0A1G9FHI3_9LACT|nr:aldehyde dehydrogenase [Alkalibacterium thalassium]SDK87875.1 aldehyde dehydrogenase (NAD+) [Alkalibacterium thalassium]